MGDDLAVKVRYATWQQKQLAKRKGGPLRWNLKETGWKPWPDEKEVYQLRLWWDEFGAKAKSLYCQNPDA